MARYFFLRDFTVFIPLAFFHFWLLGWPSVKSFLIPAVMIFNPELPTFDLVVPRHKLMNTKLSSISESRPALKLELVFSSLVNPELFSTLASSCLSQNSRTITNVVHGQSPNYLCPTQISIYSFFLFYLSSRFYPSKYGGFLGKYLH